MQKAIKQIKQCSILYIESDKDIASEMLRLYHALFKEVFYENNGEDGFENFKQNHLHIDLIITDINLAKISGIEMITKIRKEYGYKHQVIFTTCNTEDSVLLKCLKLGTSDYLIKPVKHNTHLGILIKVLKPIYEYKLIHLMNQELDIYKQSANSQLLVSKTNLEGIITYANDKFCDISGYNLDELLGKPHNIVRHPKMSKDIFAELWMTIKRGDIWSGTVQNMAKDGASYYVEAKIFPIKDDEENIIEYISFRQDITQHINLNNKAKEMLKKTKLNYSKIYEESTQKAKLTINKEFENLELALNLERDNAKKQTSKRSRAENKLIDTTQEKNKEIQHWKNKIVQERKILTKISVTNKKLSADSRAFNNDLDSIKQRLNMSQNKIIELQNDNERLKKRLEDKDDVINYLEKEVKVKSKGKF